jgi:hypothetical protein
MTPLVVFSSLSGIRTQVIQFAASRGAFSSACLILSRSTLKTHRGERERAAAANPQKVHRSDGLCSPPAQMPGDTGQMS